MISLCVEEKAENRDPSRREILKLFAGIGVGVGVATTGLSELDIFLQGKRRELDQNGFLFESLIREKIEESNNVHWSYYLNQTLGLIEKLQYSQLDSDKETLCIETVLENGQRLKLLKTSDSLSTSIDEEDANERQIEPFINDSVYLKVSYTNPPYLVHTNTNENLSDLFTKDNIHSNRTSISRTHSVEVRTIRGETVSQRKLSNEYKFLDGSGGVEVSQLQTPMGTETQREKLSANELKIGYAPVDLEVVGYLESAFEESNK